MLCKDNKEYDEAVRLMEQAAIMFQEHGTPDTAAISLEKAAKSVSLVHLIIFSVFIVEKC